VWDDIAIWMKGWGPGTFVAFTVKNVQRSVVVYIKKNCHAVTDVFFCDPVPGERCWDNLLFYPPAGTLIYTHWENGPTQGNKTRTILDSQYVSRNRGGKPRKWGDRRESDDLYVLIL
jgi:hypothetical protein